jgi:hypothetical protein
MLTPKAQSAIISPDLGIVGMLECLEMANDLPKKQEEFMKLLVRIYWWIFSTLGYSIRVRPHSPGSWWINGSTAQKLDPLFIRVNYERPHTWRFRIDDKFCVYSLAATVRSYTAGNLTQGKGNFYFPIKGDAFLLLVQYMRVSEIYGLLLGFDGMKWKILVIPDSVTGFEIKPDLTGGWVKFGEKLKLNLVEGTEGPGITSEMLLEFLGGRIGINELLYAHHLGEEARKEKRNRELLAPALQKIRDSRSYCKSGSLKEAADAIEAVLQA